MQVRGQSGFLVRYTPMYRRTARVRSALFIYRCLPTALVTAGIPRGPPPTCVSRGNLARRDPSRISNFDHHYLPDTIRDRRFAYNCARVSHMRDRIDLRFRTSREQQCCSWIARRKRLHRARNFKFAFTYYAYTSPSLRRFASLARAISVHVGSSTSRFPVAVIVALPPPPPLSHSSSVGAPSRQKSLCVKSACRSPTRHKVEQIGTSCDREAATENVPSVPRRCTAALGTKRGLCRAAGKSFLKADALNLARIAFAACMRRPVCEPRQPREFRWRQPVMNARHSRRNFRATTRRRSG